MYSTIYKYDKFTPWFCTLGACPFLVEKVLLLVEERLLLVEKGLLLVEEGLLLLEKLGKPDQQVWLALDLGCCPDNLFT